MVFDGRVFSGLGKGAYYVGHPEFKSRFLRTLGYEPFPGTLNLRISRTEEMEERSRMGKRGPNTIDGFVLDGQPFSAVKCYNGVMGGIRVSLVIPEITEYDSSVLEVIAPVKLRDALRLRDGQTVRLELEEQLVTRVDGH
ncbi:MAG: CTP-dependent riboflavin kinase [Nitrososphaerales archaeon]|nr:CTP-dependent riboflavin kinase [Nitrososphaerales archaeon]